MKFLSFLNATVGLDHATTVQDLGFTIEASPNLDGAFVVVNNPPPTLMQWLAVFIMVAAIVCVFVVEKSRQDKPASLFLIWTIGLVSSWWHNIDNILRPGTYFTPTWIVEPKIAFPMDQAFLLWIFVLAMGIISLRVERNALPLMAHSFGTSFGIAHYIAQAPSRFSLPAHFSILFEFIMGIIVGINLFQWQNPEQHGHQHVTGSSSQEGVNPRYQNVPVQEDTPTISLEMPAATNSGLRQRSKSPKVWR